ncbi:MAG: hypothetical protein LBJ76_06885 [Candidatus Accumulibacter sp.]|jgi:hypothetical protein|nr:hypothetical protein [Accumulibacter sp.]
MEKSSRFCGFTIYTIASLATWFSGPSSFFSRGANEVLKEIVEKVINEYISALVLGKDGFNRLRIPEKMEAVSDVEGMVNPYVFNSMSLSRDDRGIYDRAKQQ